MQWLRRLTSLLVVLMPTWGAEQWLKISTPNFELYTTAGEKRGIETVQHLEQIRGFFRKASQGAKSRTERKVRLVAFRGEKEYKPYLPNEVAVAYYMNRGDRDVIVMREAGPDVYRSRSTSTFTCCCGSALQRARVAQSPSALRYSFSGTFTELEFGGSGARLHLPAEGRTQVFLLDRPNMVAIRGVGGAVFEFTCGPQKPRAMTVEYEVHEGMPAGVTGLVRALEMKQPGAAP